MGKWVNIVYGVILLYLTVESFWDLILPSEFVPYAVVLMGVAILLTPNRRNLPPGFAPSGRWADFIRRRIFGIILILLGLVSAIGVLADFAPFLVLDTASGPFILAIVAVIFFLFAITRARTHVITGV